MKLRQKITLLISLALLVPTVVISTVAIYKIKSKASRDIASYHDEEFAQLKVYLKHITDIAYGVIETQHKALADSIARHNQHADSTQAKLSMTPAMMEQTLQELAAIRFDNGEGYFWVTDNKLPFPTMLMHAEKKELKGKTLDDPKHNVEKEKGRNIYQVRAERANADGDAFVEYIMKKPGSQEVTNKISYSRLYKPLGWIVSTGFYTDAIDQAVAAKKAESNQQVGQMVFFILALAALILAVGLTVSIYFSKALTTAILNIKDTLEQLAQGRRVEQVNVHRRDEIGSMTHSLNALVLGLSTYTSFAKEIGEGNLQQSFTPLSQQDILGNELLSMRNNLKKAADEKAIRDWANEGLASLGDVLRRNNTNTQELATETLRELVKYMNMNQAALFMMEEGTGENDQYLQLVAAYAYERRKYLQKTIAVGEGMVGQCVLERGTIHLREVPEEYVNITSGLGNAVPRTLLIMPLIYNEVVYGVLEMASFREFGDHEIAFLEKIAQSIAGTIASVQTNERTKKLLEQSQQMSEEMKAQEEELRQNQEELQATSEQMRRRQVELEKENERLKDELRSSGNDFQKQNTAFQTV